MAESATVESSEDVSDFLRRIKELGEQRDREDAERTRKLEEEIMEGRKQREARRLERARSLSPNKTPTGSPSSLRSSRNTANLENPTSSPLLSTPSLPPPASLSAVLSDVGTESPAKSSVDPSPSVRMTPGFDRSFTSDTGSTEASSAAKAQPIGRSGTLSWQQRPRSLVGTRPSAPQQISARPLPPPPDETTSEQPEEELEPSRADIAKSLGSKDPSWFRQTADRGRGSPAFRRNEDDANSSLDQQSSRHRLHGLGHASTQDERRDGFRSPSPDAPSLPTRPQDSVRSPSPEGPAFPARRKNNVRSESSDTPALPSQPSQNSAASEAVYEPAPEESPTRRQLPFSAERRERSQSPTKGLGGFVQSAMLRRNESVSKRWTAQGSGGLQRQNSNSGARSGGSQNLPPSNSMPKLDEPNSSSPATSNIFSSQARPQSMYSSLPKSGIVRDSETELESSGKEESRHERSRSRSALRSANESPSRGTDVTSPPVSPSKRWSPTKASWLESALNKPEISKPKTAAPTQPMWLSELNKSRQQQASSTIAKGKIETEAGVSRSPSKEESSGLSKSRTHTPVVKAKPARLSDGLTKDSSPQSPEKEQSSATSPNEPVGKQDSHAGTDSLTNTKDRPTTPTKTDLRSTLRSPNRASKVEPKGQLEFQNAFGNLRKTTTQNYVAEDVFKNNILRGKAALSVTDGPQKNAVRDELKESLIKQREAMKVKASTTDSSAHQTQPSTSSNSSTTPEAIAKRKALGRNDNSGNLQASPKARPDPPGNKSVEISPGVEPPKSTASSSSAQSVPKSGLAGRFNPALASLIAKGPPSASSERKSPVDSATTDASSKPSNSPSDDTTTSSSGRLSHITKSRARGPQRRAPKSTAEPVESSQPLPALSDSLTKVKSSSSTPPKPRTPSTGVTPKLQSQPATSPRNAQSPSANSATKPQTPLKTPRVNSIQVLPTQKVDGKENKPLSSNILLPKPTEEIKGPDSRGGSGRTSSSPTRVPADPDSPKPAASVKDAISSWGKQDTLGTSEGSRKDTKAFPKVKSEEAPSPVVGLGIDSRMKKETDSPITSQSIKPSKMATTEIKASQALKSNNTVENRSPSIPVTNKDSSLTESQGSTRLMAPNQAEQVLVDTFGALPKATDEPSIDAQSVLTDSDAAPEGSKTIKNHISEITGDGKTVSMPTQQEHILYSRAMYLCIHTFEQENSSRTTDVYLWIGSGISESTIEDVQIFAKKSARESNGTLRTVRQGREPARFFQALGGIVITRHGSRADARDSYMLCGRKHLGHVAFDEVDLVLNSLCAGFTYVVVSKTLRKVFFWKGSGSSPEEFSCARLISMDLGLESEVIELDEGAETESFLSIFSGSAGKRVPSSAGHWKLKSTHEKYKTRLFLVDTDSGNNSRPGSATGSISQVGSNLWQAIRRPSAPEMTKPTLREISPFIQSDLEPDKIFVLDAFFEVYVIVGLVANRKSDAFVAAVSFAQEYAILAASHEDRPFVPVGTVVMQGAPRDMKAVFRQWDDTAMDTGTLMAGGKGKGLKVLPLSAAVAAVRSA